MTMPVKKTYETIDEYIEDQPNGTKSALKILKECIIKAAPDAEELFNYDIPAFALIKGGKRENQIMFAGYSKHVGFYPHPDTILKFSNELKEYKQGKGSIQFPNNKPIPSDLVIRMVRWRKEMIANEIKSKISKKRTR
jgi:uncharacterized protein YdhG (YjbR/CyaY superfamily)